jgi:hypothetical protein
MDCLGTIEPSRYGKEFGMLANPPHPSLRLARVDGRAVLTATAAAILALAFIAMPHPVIPHGATQLSTPSMKPCPAPGYVSASNVLHGPSRPHRPAPMCLPLG